MIFVVLGTQKFQLNRLLKQIDDLIAAGIIYEEVFAQIGNSDYRPRHYKYVDFLPKEQFEIVIKTCDLLITHGGVGTIVAGLKYKKPIIVYPRLAKYKEHVDDHQLEIAQSFSELNYVLVCSENMDLEKLIKESHKHVFNEYHSQRKNMIDTIRQFLEQS